MNTDAACSKIIYSRSSRSVKVTRAQLLLRWPRDVLQVDFFAFEWRYTSEDITENHLLPKSSGLSKINFKDHSNDAATEQCLGMIAEIKVF